MKVKVATLDDLLYEVFDRLIKRGRFTDPSKGAAYEISGAVIELTNPRARMSRTEARAVLFSYLGEFLWIMTGSDSYEFIKYYIPTYEPDSADAVSVRAAYGPRLQGKDGNQLSWVIGLLKKKPDTRRAVISIYQPQDTLAEYPEVPCTCTLQFLLRRNRLEMIVHMRSNDVFRGLPGDVFTFTMIQELVSRSLGVEPGRYKHMVGSLHLYEGDKAKAQSYLREGYQSKSAMPPMPLGDQFASLEEVIGVERLLRAGQDELPSNRLPSYWKDIVQLLRIYRASKDSGSSQKIRKIKKNMQSDVYNSYIDSSHRRAKEREDIVLGTAQIPFPKL